STIRCSSVWPVFFRSLLYSFEFLYSCFSVCPPSEVSRETLIGLQSFSYPSSVASASLLLVSALAGFHTLSCFRLAVKDRSSPAGSCSASFLLITLNGGTEVAAADFAGICFSLHLASACFRKTESLEPIGLTAEVSNG
ncbi:MAG: hypothetical protein ACOCNY_05635, partial [Prevotella sp.]